MFRPMGLMMIDIDDFSRMNEKYTRSEADDLLKKVAQVLKTTLRPSDVICRQAKDQFLVILPETRKEEVLELAKKVKDAIQEKMAEQQMTCSIGLSRFISGMTPQEFFLQANVGLYMAKEAGKNEACLYG
ncbi:MAG: GGDEF domain-containing protein [Candidatus Omnitrophica bacterium]|nr:GGDEF domain-containing protein [Candidatus Omnitrophota bacterium]